MSNLESSVREEEWPGGLNVQMLLGFNGFSLSYSDFKSTGLQTLTSVIE